jgi:hypothetical protein
MSEGFFTQVQKLPECVGKCCRKAADFKVKKTTVLPCPLRMRVRQIRPRRRKNPRSGDPDPKRGLESFLGLSWYQWGFEQKNVDEISISSISSLHKIITYIGFITLP